jgi:hypothetical protein
LREGEDGTGFDFLKYNQIDEETDEQSHRSSGGNFGFQDQPQKMMEGGMPLGLTMGQRKESSQSNA